MLERQTYAWRFLVTGTCFALFGLGGLLLGLLVFPVMLMWPGAPGRRCARTRATVQRSFRLFVAVMSGLRGLRYEFHGAERLGRPGQLIIANHPTLVDVVFIVAFTPAPACVVKAALFANPFTRHVVRAAGYIRNAPTDEMIEKSVAALRSGDALVMFPEGTRTRAGQPLAFHRGAASVAVQAAAVLTPIYIHVDQPLLSKTLPWYKVPPRVPRFCIRVGDDIDLGPFRAAPPPRASRQLNDWLVGAYKQELERPGGYNGPRNASEIHELDPGEPAGAHADKR
jgi:1-acyl-sn-glycerol-3-phosphate acyltransferase